MISSNNTGYRGRLAPTPSGHLHIGHAQTFWIAQQRCKQYNGKLILRIEDLDQQRCKSHFLNEMIEDLTWFGFMINEGPGSYSGSHGPYLQTQRMELYKNVWQQLYNSGNIYYSPHSRQDVMAALSAPHNDGSEPIFPTSLRPTEISSNDALEPYRKNWRFRVPDGRQVSFHDGNMGYHTYTAGVDFGDFLVWRNDGFPSYEFAVVVDDHAMEITEVVRGEDLLLSTARQILLYEVLHYDIPLFYHTPLVYDKSTGKRLAKRDAMSHSKTTLRSLRNENVSPDMIRNEMLHFPIVVCGDADGPLGGDVGSDSSQAMSTTDSNSAVTSVNINDIVVNSDEISNELKDSYKSCL
jgi:glutamyl-tRNA synthetase